MLGDRRRRERVLLVVQLDHPRRHLGARPVPGAVVRDLRRRHAGDPRLHRGQEHPARAHRHLRVLRDRGRLQGGPHGMPPKLQKFFETKFGRAKADEPTSASMPRDPRRPAAPGSDRGRRRRRRARGRPTSPCASADWSPSTTSPSPRRWAASPGSSARTAPARPRRSTACSGLNRPTHGHGRCSHGDDVSARVTARPRPAGPRPHVPDHGAVRVAHGRRQRRARPRGGPGRRQRAEPAVRPAVPTSRCATSPPREALELCGITDLAHLQAGALSTGQRRLVELARCLAGPFDILLLDEPSSGLDHDETRTVRRDPAQVVRERGCGILLVEHDMALVMDVCEYIYVLDFGRLIFEGTPTGGGHQHRSCRPRTSARRRRTSPSRGRARPPRARGGRRREHRRRPTRPQPCSSPTSSPGTSTRRCCATCRSPCPPARWSRCSARTVPASRRC